MRKMMVLLLFMLVGLATRAQVQGIGARLVIDTLKDGTTLPRIQDILPGSPAAMGGLHKGQYLLSVNGLPCANVSALTILDAIRGEEGTTVKLVAADDAWGKNARKYKLSRMALSGLPCGVGEVHGK